MSSSTLRRSRRRYRSDSILRSALLGAGAVAMLASPPAWAINIVMNFNSAASQNPSQDPTAAQFTGIMQHIESFYEDVFEDAGHTLTVNFWWEDLSGGTVGNHSLVNQSAGRETECNIRLDTTLSGGTERLWFFDPTPADNSEFDMQQTLWRDMSGGTQAARFNAGANIPDTFEAGYTGLALSTAPVNAINGFDALTSAIHEVGHALGMSASNLSTQGEVNPDDDYDYDSINVFGRSLAAIDDGGDIAHLAGTDALLAGGVAAAGRRRLPSHTDLFSMAAVHNYTDLDVPRREFYGGGNWNAASSWSGNKVPGTADIVYVRNPGSVVTATLNAAAFAGTLTVSEASNVATGAFKLDVSNRVTIDGLNSDIFIDTGGELEGNKVVVQNGAQLSLRGGLVDVLSVDNLSGEVHNESGVGTIDVQNGFQNDGTLRVSSGALTLLTASAGGIINLDGVPNFLGNEFGAVEVNGGDLTIDGELTDGFNGTIDIEASRTLNMVNAWTLANNGSLGSPQDGRLNFNGGANSVTAAHLDGFIVTVGGDINVSGYAMIDSDASFQSSATIVIDAGGTLELNGDAIFAGGSYTGAGILKIDTIAQFVGDTTIDVASLDWDGNGTSITSITPDVTLTINSDEIETVAGAYDGTISIESGRLVVNTAAGWRMDGVLTMNKPTATVPSVDGQTIILGGILSSTGDGRVDASLRGDGGGLNVSPLATLTQAGALRINGGTTLNKAGNGTWTISGTQSHVGNGTLLVSAGTVIMKTDAGAAGPNLNVETLSDIVFDASQHLATLSVGPAGTARLNPGGGKVIVADDVAVAGGAPPTGRLNLTDGDLIVDYTGATPYNRFRGYLTSGYAAGAWNGNGIWSSTAAAAAANPTFALGLGEASIVLGPAGGTFSGETVDAAAILIKYTYYGDATLDGQVNVADLGKLASFWQQAGFWTEGDFNYDGMVNVGDLGLLATNWQKGTGSPLGPSLAEAMAALGLPSVAVPEPTLLAALSAGLPLAARRRRR